MKIDKKTIIILIVVAVAAYLLWKRSKGSTVLAGGDVDITTTPTYDKNNLDDCIKVAFNGDPYNDIFAAKARKIYAAKTATMHEQAEYQDKAEKKGYTIPQMAVIDGAYVECYQQNSDGTWTKRDDAHEAYFNKVKSRVQGM